ncbi:MAG: hypothetical protein A07HR60_00244 [uncultured archaeon A07HR60]|nr:MAG: hypothetical protein A07HR60_00244 [uncultured archaeon A07HR60]
MPLSPISPGVGRYLLSIGTTLGERHGVVSCSACSSVVIFSAQSGGVTTWWMSLVRDGDLHGSAADGLGVVVRGASQ